ncbi:hypothetical protein glysoja_044945 [Glycine soja]|uniref:Uncharacterized protein n=1 Tax=Glycine soja TaxID=3848 RepID=A0A0B2PEB9_GLYSO|nr:hypothetical protein glysoja_044945 [Glycine soja]
MTLPSPTTLHYQTTAHFSATFISTLMKFFSQSDYHHVYRFKQATTTMSPASSIASSKVSCILRYHLSYPLDISNL